MNRTARFGPAAVLTATALVAAIALPALAIEYPLSSTSIRNAYFMASASDMRKAEFFGKYTVVPPTPSTGPYIGMIRAETPYMQVVLRASQGVNYGSQDAQQEFLGKPANFRVHVTIVYGPGYCTQLRAVSGGIEASQRDCSHDWSYRFTQKKEIPAKSLDVFPTYSIGDITYVTGAEVIANYDIAKIESAPASFDVKMPDGQTVSATFDLDHLQ